ncbi:twin transmembrane helix small protein [Piscinibacter koreensis]|uniref:Twin transmembrane helix small protein n=1 Tax=Piscinibacter koreensis TaxID=2742824 RepID=A0A7Y6NPP7_9BURK|nr:twin transmembrane helix small protein [Schlegelella koreensis]NUZ07035.1 twin transmembrane helix small protein [Schlegelella koreensis]
MKIIVGLAFVAILAALGTAGFFMLRGGGEGSKGGHMMRALAVRVGLSILLVLCILAAYALGWIQPSGIPLGR